MEIAPGDGTPWCDCMPDLNIHASRTAALPPFAVEAFVLEQDRDLLLDPDPVLTDPGASLETLLEAALRAPRRPVGSLVVTGRSVPYCFLALVHDLGRQPSWSEASVASALRSVFAECERREFASIAMPLLGTVHGRLSCERSVALLVDVIAGVEYGFPRNLWLRIPSACDPSLLTPLAEAGHQLTFVESLDPHQLKYGRD